MSEKGGKGFSLPPKGVKSSLSKNASVRGKDDSSGKSKRGRKAKFNTEGSTQSKFYSSSKSEGKFQSVAAKGDWTKGGTSENAANGGKTPAVNEPLDLNIGAELPENAKLLMDCEAAHILEGIQEQMVALSADPTIKIPMSFDRGLQYAKTTSQYTDPQSVRQLLQTLTRYGVSDDEMIVIANVCPETVDEAFALLTSLKAKRSLIEQPLKDILSGLAELRKSTWSLTT